MGFSLKVKYPQSLIGKGKIEMIEKMKPNILNEMGTALLKLIREWLRQLSATRGKHTPSHFDPDPNRVPEPVVQGNNVYVSINIPGITRALHAVVIRPIEAKMLAIPISPEVYGMQPREYNIRFPKGHPEALFRPKNGKSFLAKKGNNGQLVVMYYLRDMVKQPQDRTLLPPDEQMDKAINDSLHDALFAILNT